MLGLFLATVLFIYPIRRTPTQRITVEFAHDAGLAPVKEGSPVLLGGAVQVGSVSDIERTYVSREPGAPRELMIRVVADIDRDLELYANCQITTDQPAVGGAGFMVILDIGSPDQPRDTSATIAGLPPQSLAATISNLSRRLLAPDGVIDQIERLVNPEAEGSLMYGVMRSVRDLNTITASLSHQLSPHEQQTLLAKLNLILDDVREATRALSVEAAGPEGLMARVRQSLGTLQTALGETALLVSENRPVITRTLQSVDQVAARLDRELLAAIGAELDRNNPGSLMGKLHKGMTSLNEALDDVAEITSTGHALVSGNRVQLDRTLANVREMSEQLRLASEEIRLAPWKLLYRPSPEETREMTVFEAARSFAQAASALDSVSSRLEALLAAHPDGELSPAANAELREIRASLQSAFERYQRAEHFLFERLQ